MTISQDIAARMVSTGDVKDFQDLGFLLTVLKDNVKSDELHSFISYLLVIVHERSGNS
ncbi:hypothetical protein NST41_33940 [Paenibacillus sp. FSL L8-0696]|uniref:hypothetical protein n=1 Tax=Paenibacillus sp. FSL L8-0696 TaxID=2954524 RepID=UPI00311A8903